MARKSAIQLQRNDVQRKIDRTERDLRKLVSERSIMRQIEIESESDASVASSTPSEHLPAALTSMNNATNGTFNRPSDPDAHQGPYTPPADSSESTESSESSKSSDDGDGLREFCHDQFSVNNRLVTALQQHRKRLLCKAESLAAQRYFNRAKKYTDRGPGHGMTRCPNVDHNGDHELFVREIRMSKKAFDELCEAIEGHDAFKTRGRKPQAPVKIQLAVALWRFGGYGNRASARSAAQWSGYSMGSVVKFTDRVLLALNDPSFRRRIIRWPNQAERELSKAWMESKTCPEWRNG